MESKPWTAHSQANNHLVPDSCEVTTSSSLAALNLLPSSLGTPLHGAGTFLVVMCVCMCMSPCLGAGSVYNLAVCVLPMRQQAQLRLPSFSAAFLYRMCSLPLSFHFSPPQSADRLMLRITLPKIQWLSWPTTPRRVQWCSNASR